MTIVTKPISQDRKDDKDKEALVKPPHDGSDVSIPVSDSEVEIETRPPRRGMRFLSCASHSCLLITAAVALTIGVIGAFHVYRSMSGHHYYRGFCRLPYPKSHDETLITGDFGRHHMMNDDDDMEMMGRMNHDEFGRMRKMTSKDMKQIMNRIGAQQNGEMKAEDGDTVEPLKKVVRPELVENLEINAKLNPNGGLELDYELDLDLEEFESLQLPEISHGRYLHDFKVNKTAIIDPDGKRCFVMPLNRNEITPPRSLMEIISKLKNGAFELDLDEIRHDTRVVLPPLQSLEGYGFFIASSCSPYKTYRLEEVSPTRIVVKRSADEPLTGFVEFAGKSLIKYNILNLDDIKDE